MSYRIDRIIEVLDEGKRCWSLDDAGGNAGIFYREFVLPLRDLHDEGLFERFHELQSDDGGKKIISRVEIGGAVKVDFDVR